MLPCNEPILHENDQLLESKQVFPLCNLESDHTVLLRTNE